MLFPSIFSYLACKIIDVRNKAHESLGVSQSGDVIAEKPQIKDGRKIEITAVLSRGFLSN